MEIRPLPLRLLVDPRTTRTHVNRTAHQTGLSSLRRLWRIDVRRTEGVRPARSDYKKSHISANLSHCRCVSSGSDLRSQRKESATTMLWQSRSSNPERQPGLFAGDCRGAQMPRRLIE